MTSTWTAHERTQGSSDHYSAAQRRGAMSNDDDPVLLDREAGWAWLRLNRPRRLNALTDHMLQRLDLAVEEINNDPAIRVIVFTGNGKAFCAGRDTAELDEVNSATHDVPPRVGHHTNRIADIEVPVIAAVNGAAVGGGMGMALMADIVLATEAAYFVDGHLAVGMCPSSAVWWLPRLTSYQRAMEVFLTGRRVSAAEARELGMATCVLPVADLSSECRRLAADMARSSRATLTRTKRAVRFALTADFPHSTEQVGYLRSLPKPEAQ